MTDQKETSAPNPETETTDPEPEAAAKGTKAASEVSEGEQPEHAPASDAALTAGGKVGLLTTILENIPRASMLIFLAASFAIIFMLIAYIPFSAIENIEVLRSVQFLLTLAATAIILSLLTRPNQTTFTLIFGFMIIAALIVPTRDVIRFALLATGSDKQFGAFFPDARGTKSHLDRTDDIANEVLRAIRSAERRLGGGVMEVSEEAARSQESLVGEISKVLKRGRDIETVARLAQKGALETLKAIARGEKDEWIYRFAGNEEFQSNVDYLRFEGVVTSDYGDLELTEVTSYGCTLLRDHIPSTPKEGSVTYPECPRVAANATETVENYWTADVSLDSDGMRLSFTVKEGGMYELCAVPASSNADPELALTDENGRLLASNDDFGDSYAARIGRQLKAEKEYFLEARDISGQWDGLITLLIRRQETSQPTQARCQVPATGSPENVASGDTADPGQLGDEQPATDKLAGRMTVPASTTVPVAESESDPGVEP